MQVKLMLKQHVGAPAKAIVVVGQTVRRGQRIAERDGLGAHVHSSVTGTVLEVNDQFVLIEGEVDSDYQAIEPSDQPLELIERAGVVGAGGAGFPTHVKLNIQIPGGSVIANAAECEPLLSHNIQLMETDPGIVIRGLLHAKAITGAAHAYIAIKAKHTSAIKAIEQALQDRPEVELKILPDMYPSGDERVIVRELLGIELEVGALPSVANAVIQNVETLKRISQAIDEHKPFIEKDLTVAGRVRQARKGQVMLDVPLGQSVMELIDHWGGRVAPYGEIVLGGPYTGQSGNEQSVVSKTLGGVIVAMPLPQERSKIGLLVCDCGASEARMRQIAEGMGAEIVAVEKCKRMKPVNQRDRCELPGICPGQTEKVLMMKKMGMQTILAGSCGD